MRRWLHRRGAVFRATLRPPGGTPAPGAAEHDRPALVRISTTIGWPRPLPDWVGLGIRVVDDAELDLLLASAATEPDLWCSLRARRDVLACSFSSAVRYPIGGVDQVVAAAPIGTPPPTTLDQLLEGRVACPIRYRLDLAASRGTWRGLGDLELVEQLDDDHGQRMSPPASGPRPITTARRALYRLAQR
ncbi:MAG: hypothetical protein ACRD2C_22505 [Acidimicrobiales bacterium]